MMTRAMRIFLFGMTALFMFVSARAEGARSLSVVSFDSATGVASLAFESSESASLLYAVADTGDRGTDDAEAWRKAAYLGTVAGETTSGEYAVPSAWLAEPCVIRFVLTTEHERPYDAEIDYIVSDAPASGTHAYVDTKVVPDATTSVEISFVQRTGDSCAFGVSGAFYLFSNSSSTFYSYFADSELPNSSFANFMTDNNRVYNLRLGPDGAYVDGVRKVGPFKKPTKTASSTLTLGARRDDGQTSVAKSGYFRLYGAKIVKGGRLVRDFIPVRTAEGVRCLFDRVTRQLFKSANSSVAFDSMRGDAEVVKGSDFPTDVTGWSGAVCTGRSVAVTDFDDNAGIATVEFSGGSWSGRLFALRDVSDKGTDPAAWESGVYLDRIAADQTSCEVRLPSEWLATAGAVRLVWASDVESPYASAQSSVTVEGTSFVDTKIWPGLDTKIEVTAWMPDTSVDCVFGLSKILYLFTNTAKGKTFYYGFQSAAGNKTVDKVWGNWRTLTVGPEGAFVDDAEVAGPFAGATAVTPYESLVFFGRRNNETGAVEKNLSKRSVRRVKIWEGSRLVRDYIACKRTETDTTGCFYERVSGAYAGGGYGFALANAVTPTIAGDEPIAVSDVVPITGLKTATWDGGATDLNMTSAANWAADETPNLSDGTLVATFAATGEKAVVDTDANLAGVVLDAATDFTLEAASGKSLTLGAAGIAMKQDRMLELEVPTVVAVDQEWRGDGGRKGRVNVRAPLVGDVDRTLAIEKTSIGLYVGSPDYKGTVEIRNGAVAKLFAKADMFGDAAIETPVVFDLANGTLIDFFATVVDRPLTIRSGSNMSLPQFISHAYDGETTTRFLKPVRIEGGSPVTWEFGSGTVTSFESGLTAEQMFRIYGTGGTMRFSGSPLVEPSTLSLEGTNQAFVFAVASNDVNEIVMALPHNRLEYAVDNAAYWSQRNGVGHAPVLVVSSNSVIDVKNTYQCFSAVTLPETASITGEAGAVFRTIVQAGDCRWAGAVEGAVTLSKGGGNTMHLDAVSTSTGDLICNNGALQINSRGSWAGTNIVISAEATAAKPAYRFGIYNSNAFANGRKTVLSLSGFAQMRIGEGVRQKVKRLEIEGRAVSVGTWGSSASDAENKDDVHFDGTGVLDVRGGGLAIVVR